MDNILNDQFVTIFLQ